MAGRPPAGGCENVTVTDSYRYTVCGAAGYSYVLCLGACGYIAGPNDDYPLIETTPLPDEEVTDTSGGSGTIIAAVVIGILVVAALALALLSGRKTRKRKDEADPFQSGRYR